MSQRIVKSRFALATCVVAALGLVAVLASSLEAGSWWYGKAKDTSYSIEHYPFPSEVEGIDFGDYSAISNHLRLVSAFDQDFDTVGIIEHGSKSVVFRVGEPLQSYTWYSGINDKGTTVGYTQPAGSFFTAGWIRGRYGHVRTFEDDLGSVYLYRVNDRDVAVGELVDEFGVSDPIIVDRHGLHVVEVPGIDSDDPAFFTDNNNWGAIVGGMFDAVTQEARGFLWNKHGVSFITHEGAQLVAPQALNNKGQVAGFWFEEGFDPVLQQPREHGFIWDCGKFRTVDIESGLFEDELDLGNGTSAELVDETTRILDLNDRGEIVIQATGWYLQSIEFEGQTFEFVFPAFANAIGIPDGGSHGKGKACAKRYRWKRCRKPD